MGRPRKGLMAADTMDRLRATALEHFGRHGFAQTSLEGIATAEGVTRTTLLYHFTSKENLYNAVVQDAFTKIASVLLTSMIAGGDARTCVRRMIKRFIDHIEGNPNLSKLMIREVIDERAPGCDIVVNQGLPVLEMVETFLMDQGKLRPDQRELLREILLQIATSVLLKSASGAMREAFWGKRPRTGELAELLVEGLLGLGAPEAAKPRPRKTAARRRPASKRRLGTVL